MDIFTSIDFSSFVVGFGFCLICDVVFSFTNFLMQFAFTFRQNRKK